MVGWRVDVLFPPRTRDHITVVNKDRPDLDHDEKEQVELLVHWADKDKDARGSATWMMGSERHDWTYW